MGANMPGNPTSGGPNPEPSEGPKTEKAAGDWFKELEKED